LRTEGIIVLINGQLIFKFAAGLYGLSLVCAFAFGRRPQTALLFLVPALLANAAVVTWRYWLAWPMLPMYLGPVVLPLILGAMLAVDRHPSGRYGWAGRAILTLIVIIALAAVLFPKDFYLPFVKSQTVWAHLFFWFGAAGRGCFLVAAAWAMAGLIEKEPERKVKKVDIGRDHRFSAHPSSIVCRPSTSNLLHHRYMPWTIWGFAFWTLSMFAGELWSYLGWGTPVVWDDPAITTTMATWFFYICLLHLHLTGSWTPRGRCAYAAGGALVVFGLNCIPELGPFRWPL
jgi:hypothetical protein